MSSRTPADVCVIHVAEALGGGLLEMVRIVCEGHVQAGLRTDLVHGRRPETPQEPIEGLLPDGVQAIEVDGWGSRSPLREPIAIWRLRAALHRLDPDVVVFHSSFAGVAGIPMMRGVPTVFVPHAFASQLPGSRARRVVLETAERAACRRHTVTASVSHSEGGVARRLGAARVITIPNGAPALDSPYWPADASQPSPPTVLGAGRLVPQRRPIEAARILAAVSDLAEVRWVGGGGAGDYAVRAENALSRARVPVSGWIPHAAVADELRRASVYLHWASWDGLPITVLEAIAHDAVVVASDTEPNREVLGGQAVFRTEDQAIAAIRALLADPAAWRRALDAQRVRGALYSAKAMKTEWNRLVLDLASQRG